MRFFDTNILLYSATDQDPRKGDIARELIAHAITVNHDGCISTQVLGEFANVMIGKLQQTQETVDGYLDYFRDLLKTDVTIAGGIDNVMLIFASYTAFAALSWHVFY